MLDKDLEIKRLTELLAELNAKYLYMSDLVFKFRNNNSALIAKQMKTDQELKVYRQNAENARRQSMKLRESL